MFFSPPTLHPPLITTDQDRDFVRSKIAALTAGRPKRAAGRIAAGTSFSIPLTTVSKLGNFDSLIDVQFSYQGGNPITATLLADSGNSNMIIPNGEDLVGVPGYTILGTAREPWGCPANVVQGPLQIVATDGGIYRMDSCVFYACTANNSKNQRTANFGMAKINPWSASSWNTPLPKKPNVILQSPLSYGTAPYAEVIFEPATTMLSSTADVLVSRGSSLVMHATAPSGYTLLSTIPDLAWMSVVPTSFAIGGTTTGWPGSVSPLIAMVDTGGGPVLLSDPNGYVWPKTWPLEVDKCPGWTSSSVHCNCISDRLQISLAAASGGGTYAYTINPIARPPTEWGLTAVMCEVNHFLEGQQGMNVGGISFLFNRLLIDYAGAQVGLAPNMPP
jgi:hypothetical protein